MIPEQANYYIGFKDGEYAITDGEHKNSPWENIVEWYVYLSIRTFAVSEHVVNSKNDKGIDSYRTGYIDGVRSACKRKM